MLRKSYRSPHLLARTLNVYVEALTGLSHIYHLNNTLKAVSLGTF